MKHVLEVDSVRLEYANRVILSDIYLKCETGRVTGLLGRNGQGKSCLMKIIYGQLNCDRSVRFDGISNFFSFRNPELLLFLPQFNFIPVFLSLKRIFYDFGLDYSVFEEWAPEFSGKRNRTLQSFSGGERRLVEVYTIVKAPSHFAMLDEPFSHLSPLQIEKVKDLLVSEKKHKGLLITDHMYGHIVEISNYLYVLVNGKTHLTRNVEDVVSLGYVRNL